MAKPISFILNVMLLMPLASLQNAQLAYLHFLKSKDMGQKTGPLNAMIPGHYKAGAATTLNNTNRLCLELVKTKPVPK